MASGVEFEIEGFTPVETREILALAGEGASTAEIRPSNRSGAISDAAAFVGYVVIAGRFADYMSALFAKLAERFAPTVVIDLRGSEPRVKVVRDKGPSRIKTLVVTSAGDELEVFESEGGPQLPELLRELLK